MIKVRNGSTSSNQQIMQLSREDYSLLSPHLKLVDLPLRKMLESANKPIDTVYFLDSGLASVTAFNPSGNTIEVGLIGREGVTGLAVILGAKQSPGATTMQQPGRGLQISANHLHSALEKSAGLRASLQRYAHVFMVQVSHGALVNGRNTLEIRLARWLLMADDRTGGTELRVTHELLALTLGVRRAGVTVALSALTELSLVQAGRGAISIVNRKGLEKLAGDAYGVPESEFKRLFS